MMLSNHSSLARSNSFTEFDEDHRGSESRCR